MKDKFKKMIGKFTGYEDEEAAKRSASRQEQFDYIIELLKVVIISAAIVIPIRYFLIQPFFVSGASMQPQFHNGEYLIIDELTYRTREPKRGDVIVFRYPKDTSQFYIKRIIGLPGETVQVKDEKVEIFNEENPWGLLLDEPYLRNGDVTRGDIYVKVEPGHYFVLGDNRQASSDSRMWGTVEKKYIIGKVWLRAWPPDRAKIFSDQITY